MSSSTGCSRFGFSGAAHGSAVFVVVLSFSGLSLFLSSAAPAGAEPAPNPYAGLLLSHADPVERPVLSGYFLTFPPALIGQFAFRVAGPVAGVATAGYSWFPSEGQGVLASGLLRFEVAAPTEDRWGVVALGGWVGGAAVVRGEGGGASIAGAQVIASSPLRAFRVHAGAALHTMPGQAYDPRTGTGETYDFANPQPSLFLSGELSTRSVRYRLEAMGLGIGADEGWDSALLALAGAEVPTGRALLRFAAGVFVGSPGTSGMSPWPAPLIVSVAVPVGGG
ncbi:MAG: hypothetical protein ABIH26_00555 [Candidatus Eisenbacteria bacterium]